MTIDKEEVSYYNYFFFIQYYDYLFLLCILNGWQVLSLEGHQKKKIITIYTINLLK